MEQEGQEAQQAQNQRGLRKPPLYLKLDITYGILLTSGRGAAR
jgi:hypothetical protein